MSKERWIGADDPSQPVSCPRRLRSEPLVLVAAPADQVGIYPLQVSQQSRPVKVAVVVDPALDVRIKHPRQIIQGLFTPSMECPSTDRLPYCLQRFWTCRGQERDTELPAVPDRRPRPKLVAEEFKRLDRMVSAPVRILAVDELCLLRMQSQPAGHDACLQGAPQYLRRFGASAVADDIVRVPLEPDRESSVPSTCRRRSAETDSRGRDLPPHLAEFPLCAARRYRPPTVPAPSASARCREAPSGSQYVCGPPSGAAPSRCYRNSSAHQRLAPNRTASTAAGPSGLRQSPTVPADIHKSPHGRSVPGRVPGTA